MSGMAEIVMPPRNCMWSEIAFTALPFQEPNPN